MLHTTDAIVLALQPLSDRAHLLKVYTRLHGRTAYRVYGLGRKHAAGLYAPLSLVQITANGSSLRSTQLTYVPTNIPFDPRRQAICLFVSEVIAITHTMPMQDEEMYDYLAAIIQAIDQTTEPENIHLHFLVGLAAKLGFAISPDTYPQLLTQPRTRAQRQQQLKALCDYFGEHIDTWYTPKSLDVLFETFD